MFYIVLIACVVVGIVLVWGLWNMMSGGSANKSQQLMRLRVAVQAIAVIIVVIVVYLSR